ncbi:hypothetical protein Tco_1166411 [Tanacetum coccineum]
MTTLQFANTHNLVAFLAKPGESEGFEQIVDFLNANSIRYALTVNPTICTSCIDHFWAIVKVKTVNEEQQLQALVDGKKIIITEATVRRDLQLEDADGVDCKGLAMPTDPHHIPIITQPSSSQPQRKQKSRRPKEKDTQIPQFSVPSDPTNVADKVVTEEPTSLGDQEDASKQGRTIHGIDADEDITLDNVYDADMFKVNDLDCDVVVVESEVTNKAVPVSAATITNVELTLAQTLAELKSARPKTKGVVMQEPSESTPTISLQLPSQKDQIKFNEEEALRLQAKFDEEDRLAREKAQQVEEANIAWDDIQAKIDADYQLAKRLQAQEQ